MINLYLVGKTTYMLVVPGDLSSRSLRPTHHRTSPIILIPLVFSRLLSQSLTSSSFLFFLNIKFPPHHSIPFLIQFCHFVLYSLPPNRPVLNQLLWCLICSLISVLALTQLSNDSLFWMRCNVRNEQVRCVKLLRSKSTTFSQKERILETYDNY